MSCKAPYRTVGRRQINEAPLTATTGNEQVDEIIRGIVGRYESAFPNRVRGYYLLGSWADGDAGPLSDIDMCVLFRGAFAEGEEERAAEVAHSCAHLSPLRLDLGAAGELRFPTTRVSLKTDGLLVYGEDSRDSIPWPPLDAYTRQAMEIGFYFLTRILRRVEAISLPLAYPDPEGEFYGYDQKRVTEWYPPTIDRGLKELITSVCRMATALVALQGGRFVGSKGGSVRAYRQCVDDQWVDYLETLYQKGKHCWGYLIPERMDDRHLLRDLCRRTLAFENHYLRLYCDYLLTQLDHADANVRSWAAERLEEVHVRQPDPH